MRFRANGRAIFGKGKAPNLQYLGAFYELRNRFYLCDFSNALKVRTLRAMPIPNETNNIANLDWVWPAGKIK
jgi:hypothetical protein